MTIDLITLIQVIVNGLLYGCVLCGISIGLSLIFGIMRIINFAHGDQLMLTMYIAYWLWYLMGLEPIISVVISTPFFFIIGVFIQKFIFNPMLSRPHLNQLTVSLGLMMFLQNLALLLWKTDFRSVSASYSRVTLNVTGLLVSLPRLLTAVISIVLMCVLYVFLKKTYLGIAIRSVGQDLDGASIMGINSSRLYLLTFGIGLTITGVVGSFLTTHYYINPYVGGSLGMMAWVVAILGGAGSLRGTFLGALTIGLVHALSIILLPTQYTDLITYIIFILTLLFKPEGLFGRRL